MANHRRYHDRSALVRTRVLIVAQDYKCHYCDFQWPRQPLNTLRRSMGIRRPTLDHKLSRHHNGSDERDNTVLACQKCNNDKGAMSYEDFIANRNDPEKLRMLRRAAQEAGRMGDV